MALPPSSPLLSTALKDKTFKFRVDFYSGFQFKLSMFLVGFPSCPICTHLSFQVTVHMFTEHCSAWCCQVCDVAKCHASLYRCQGQEVVCQTWIVRRRSPRRRPAVQMTLLGSNHTHVGCSRYTEQYTTHTLILSVNSTHIIDVCTMPMNTCQSPFFENIVSSLRGQSWHREF